MQNKPVALITGANQGIGLQIAKELAAKNFTVLVGSRDYARGEEAAKTVDGDAHALQLDVTDQASIAAAAERTREGFGAVRALRRPLPMCHAAVQTTFEHRESELGCLNPEFGELPAGSPTFRVFARVADF